MKPKKINNITVYFEGNPSGSKTPITSKLIVTCPPGEGSDTGIKWVYYLKDHPVVRSRAGSNHQKAISSALKTFVLF